MTASVLPIYPGRNTPKSRRRLRREQLRQVMDDAGRQVSGQRKDRGRYRVRPGLRERDQGRNLAAVCGGNNAQQISKLSHLVA